MFYLFLYLLIGLVLGFLLAWNTLRLEGWESPDWVTAPLFVLLCAVLWPVIAVLSWRDHTRQRAKRGEGE